LFVRAHDTAWRNAHNFSGGPGALPRGVLDQLAQVVLEVPEVGLSLLGISHRSDWFQAVVREAEATIRALLGLRETDWAVIFLQGGASLQFTMALANLGCVRSTPVDWVRAGYWSAQAMREASFVCSPHMVWDGRARGYCSLPGWAELKRSARILHYVSNETVEGLAFAQAPPRSGDQLVVCDMSSDFLSRPVDLDRHDLIYAHAQKNLGPAGVTVVLIRRELLESVPDGLAPMLDYRVHAGAGSIHNTPPVVAIYTMLLVLRWLSEEIGGLERMAERNATKAACVYEALEARPDLYSLQAHAAARSSMNCVFQPIVDGISG
jgi:phosphoserine aminotransferase